MNKSLKNGRPSLYSIDLIENICEKIAHGKSLVSICKEPNMPNYSTITRWLRDTSKSEFLEMYNQARSDQADYFAEEIIDIADNRSEDHIITEDGKAVVVVENIHRSRLKVDSRKWYASKLKPKIYGDRQHVDVDMKVSIADKIAEARKRIANAEEG